MSSRAHRVTRTWRTPSSAAARSRPIAELPATDIPVALIRTSVPVRAPAGVPAALVAFAFVTLVCGSNALTPLLPLYAEQLRLTSLDRAVVFCGYFLGLISVLVLAARTRLVQAARAALLSALAISVLGDLALILGAHTPGLLVGGRVLIGISVALGTGSAAALMVAARGEGGRAFIATGSLVGACAGLGVALAVVTWLPGPMTTVYLLHATVALATLAVLLLTVSRSSTPRASGAHLSGSRAPLIRGERTRGDRRARWAVVGAFAAGGVGWAFGALATGVLPATMRLQGMVSSTPVAVAVGGIALLTSCIGIAVGLGSPGARMWPLVVAAGWVLVALALWMRWLPLVFAGCAFGGVGQAGAYRSGLRRLTGGLDPVGQGRATSAFSAVAYSSCAASLLLSGWLELWLGAIPGTLTLAGLVLLVATIVTALPLMPDPVSAVANPSSPDSAVLPAGVAGISPSR